MYRVLYSSWQCKHQMCTVLGEPSYSFGRTHQFGRTWHTPLHSYTWAPVTNGCAWTLTYIRLFATPWTVAHQPPLLMGFSRQDFPSHSMGFSMLCGLSFPPQGIFPISWVSYIGRWILYHWPPTTWHWWSLKWRSRWKPEDKLPFHLWLLVWRYKTLSGSDLWGWLKKKQRERKGTNGQKGVQVGGFDVWAPSA